MRFIAKRQNADETVTAILTCSDQTDFSTPKEFIQRLRKALTQWLTHNEIGKKAWVDSCESFNFGDLALYGEDAALHNILAMNGIFAFEISVVTNVEEDFDYDSNLADIKPWHES